MIRKLNNLDALKSAELHLEGMPDDFLPSFGIRFLQLLHKQLLSDNRMIALGFEKQNQLIGILLATVDTTKTMRRVYLRAFIRLLPWIILKTVTQPHTLKYLWQILVYSRNYPGLPKAEILVLSVARYFRHRGIGNTLMQALNKEFRQRGTRRFKVSTRTNNASANAFYKKTGGVYIKEFSIFGRSWNIYVFEL